MTRRRRFSLTRRALTASGGFTLTEMLATVAVLIILLGLMVDLAHYVRDASANEITKNLLMQLDSQMARYISRNGGRVPEIYPLIDSPTVPDEQTLTQRARQNIAQVVRYLKSQQDLSQEFSKLSISYYDEVTVRDAWGSPIVFMPHLQAAIGMSTDPRRSYFFFSAGPDKQYLTKDDNLYSYEQ